MLSECGRGKPVTTEWDFPTRLCVLVIALTNEVNVSVCSVHTVVVVTHVEHELQSKSVTSVLHKKSAATISCGMLLPNAALLQFLTAGIRDTTNARSKSIATVLGGDNTVP